MIILLILPSGSAHFNKELIAKVDCKTVAKIEHPSPQAMCWAVVHIITI